MSTTTTDPIAETAAVPTEIRPCLKCGTPITIVPVFLLGKWRYTTVRCDACEDLVVENEARREAEEKQRTLDERWRDICPPLYRETDPARLPAAVQTAMAAWQYTPRGLGIFGAAGQGKTRACYHILHRCLQAGHTCYAITATRFAMASADQYHDDPERRDRARASLDECHQAAVLFLDDLGKNKFTDRVELDLFDVLEHRTSHLIPTLWTANASGQALIAMLSPDRAQPLIRRLVEFSEIVKV